MFRDNLSVPSPGFKKPKENLQPQYGFYIGKSVTVLFPVPLGRLQHRLEYNIKNGSSRNWMEDRGLIYEAWDMDIWRTMWK